MAGPSKRAPRTRRPLLLTARPDLAAQWVAELTGADLGQVTIGSSRNVTWRCPDCGTEWVATVANRVYNGSGCPACARRRLTRPAPGRSLAELYPALARQPPGQGGTP